MTKTILIADDDSDVLDTLRETFEDEGYTVSTATDGAVALQHLSAMPQAPCAAILDIMMPKLSGAQVYQAMQNDHRLAGVQVIFCTSAPGAAPSGTIMMKKPINLSVLISAVHECCGD